MPMSKDDMIVALEKLGLEVRSARVSLDAWKLSMATCLNMSKHLKTLQKQKKTFRGLPQPLTEPLGTPP